MRAPNESAAAREFHQRWNGGAPIVDEAEKHRFTAAFVSQVLVRRDPRWGRKSRAAGQGPVSKDTVAYWLGPVIPTEPADGPLDARDLLTSSGADSWNSDDDPAYNEIHARWYPVEPAGDGVATVPAVAGTGVAGAMPASDASIDTLLADLEARLRDHVDVSLARMSADLRDHLDVALVRMSADSRAGMDGLPDRVAAAVAEAVGKLTSDLEAKVASSTSALPKEYELRSLGRVIGTLAPKQ